MPGRTEQGRDPREMAEKRKGPSGMGLSMDREGLLKEVTSFMGRLGGRAFGAEETITAEA